MNAATERHKPNMSTKVAFVKAVRGMRRNNFTQVVFTAGLCDKGPVLPVSPVPYAAGNQGPLKKERLVNY